MNNSLLICGGSGLLGSSFVKKLHKKFDIVHATYLNKKIDNKLNIYYHKINFLSEIEIKKLLVKIKPSIVINCVGLADVDYCQNNPKKAHKLNFITLKNLSNLLDPKTKLIHISTDQLFSDKKKFHSESSETKPINTYAKTKLLADKYLLKNRKSSLIIRTNFYGHSSDHKESYSEKIYSSLKKNENLYLSDEIYFNPVNTIDLVNLTYKILKKNASGIFNISSDTPISKYKFGKLISKKFNLDEKLIKKISNVNKSKTKRPLNMVLSNSKIKKYLKLKSIKMKFYDFIPDRFLNYGRHFIFDDDKNSVLDALNSGQLTQGNLISKFESIICKYTGAKYAVAVSSCTAGLHLSCTALGIKKNDNVIVPAITFVSTANAVIYNNANVILSDIDLDTLNISQDNIEKISKTKKIKAIMPVHFAGYPCEIKKIRYKNKKQIIIEDAAHALGARYSDGSKVGSCKYSDATVFSFHPVKPITAGEGGVVTTNSFTLYKKLMRLRSHGINKLDDAFENKKYAFTNGKLNPWFYEMKELGYHYRITDIQCALAISQMKKLDKFISRRKKIAGIYRKKFNNLNKISIAHKKDFNSSGHHLFILRFDFKNMSIDKVNLMNELKKLKIGTQVHYIPISLHPFYKKTLKGNFNIKNAMRYYDECLSIPLFYDLSLNEQNYVIENIIRLAK